VPFLLVSALISQITNPVVQPATKDGGFFLPIVSMRNRDVMVNISDLKNHFNREAINQPQTKPITPDSGNPKDVVLARSRATKTHTTSNTIP
jgi:hypothetical protein